MMHILWTLERRKKFTIIPRKIMVIVEEKTQKNAFFISHCRIDIRSASLVCPPKTKDMCSSQSTVVRRDQNTYLFFFAA